MIIVFEEKTNPKNSKSNTFANPFIWGFELMTDQISR